MSRWSANTILVLVTWYVRRFPHPCVRQCSSSNVQIIQILYTREIDNDASLFHQSGNHVYPSLDGDRRVPLKPLIRLRSKGNVRCTFHVARGPIHLIAFQPWTEFAFILCAQKRGDCRGWTDVCVRWELSGSETSHANNKMSSKQQSGMTFPCDVDHASDRQCRATLMQAECTSVPQFYSSLRRCSIVMLNNNMCIAHVSNRKIMHCHDMS